MGTVPAQTLLILPGLDGTGRLLREFARYLPPCLHPVIVSYPPDRPMGYDELERIVALPDAPFTLVGESFSGPLAIRIAARRPMHLKALVLVGTFLRRPHPAAPRWMRWLACPALFRGRPPGAALRLLLGRGAPEQLVREFSDILCVVRPEVLAHRLREALTIDVSDAFPRVNVPVLSIRGRRDRWVTASSMRSMRRLQPDLTAVELDAPHLVLQFQPRASADAIVQWLKE